MRNTPLTQWALFSVPLLLVLAALLVGFGSEADVEVYFLAHRAAHPALRTTMQWLSDWSNPLFYTGYALALFGAFKSGNRKRLRFILILIAVQAVVSGLAVHFLKFTIGRPRPGQGEWFEPLSSHGTQHSLPSGHTTEITGWTLPLALRLNRTWVSGLLGLFLGLVGFSRIYLGWHHPTDVFFGWLLGCAGGLAAVTLANTTLFTRRP